MEVSTRVRRGYDLVRVTNIEGVCLISPIFNSLFFFALHLLVCMHLSFFL